MSKQVIDSRKKSVSEAFVNSFGGYPIGYGVGIIVLPLSLGWIQEDPLVANLAITLVYAVVSFVRSYFLRRIFEKHGIDDNFDTGATLWLGPPRAADNTAFVKAGGLLFQLNQNAELIVTRARRTGPEPIARYTVADSATWAQPAISGHRAFVKDVQSLTLWTFD